MLEHRLKKLDSTGEMAAYQQSRKRSGRKRALAKSVLGTAGLGVGAYIFRESWVPVFEGLTLYAQILLGAFSTATPLTAIYCLSYNTADRQESKIDEDGRDIAGTLEAIKQDKGQGS